MKQQEEGEEEEEEEDEVYEEEQTDIIREAASLDDMAKLITVEEVSTGLSVRDSVSCEAAGTLLMLICYCVCITIYTCIL